MPRKVDAGDVLAALGGVLVLVSLFLEWYEDATGWQAFEALDLVLAALALAAIAAALSGFGLRSFLSPRALLPIGLALLVIVAVQLIEPPPVVGDLDIGPGGWLALAGAALVVTGGILRTAAISVTVNVGGRDARPRVPAVDRRPASSDVAGEGAGAVRVAHPPASAAPLADTQATQPFQPVRPDEEP